MEELKTSLSKWTKWVEYPEYPENYTDWRKMTLHKMTDYARCGSSWNDFTIPHDPLNKTLFVQIFNDENLFPLGVYLYLSGRDFKLRPLS